MCLLLFASAMAPRKGSSPFSRVKSPELLDSNKQWYVLSSGVCGERPPKYFDRNKFPGRFPDDIRKVKRSALQTVDGAAYQGKASSEDEIVASSFGLIATFLRHAPDSQLFKEETFERLKDFLNSLDLSVCEAETVGSLIHVAASSKSSTPVRAVKAPANRRLAMPLPSSVELGQDVDEDTGCSLLTPPSSCSKSPKKVSSLGWIQS